MNITLNENVQLNTFTKESASSVSAFFTKNDFSEIQIFGTFQQFALLQHFVNICV